MNKKLIVLSAICLVFTIFGCDSADDNDSSDTNQAGESGAVDQGEVTGGAGASGEGGAAGDAGAAVEGGDAGTAADDGVVDSCQFESCGGDVIGDWRFDQTCAQFDLDENPFEGFCPEATLEFDFTVSGTISFGEDGRYARNITTGGNSTATVPADCLQGNLSCEDLEAALSTADPDDPDAVPLTASCTQDGFSEPCVCRIETEESTEMEVGAYETAETQVSFTPDEGQPDFDPITAEFCVQGDNLKVLIPGDEEEPAQTFLLSR